MPDLVGILLAAGNSRRFGADKLRQPLSDALSVAEHACRNLASSVDQVWVVVRPGATQLARQLEAQGAKVLTCPHAAQGMGISLSHAIKATPNTCGWLIALADMPWIQPASIAKVAAALRHGAPLAAPFYHHQRGHPVGFAQSYYPALSSLTGDAGAKPLLESAQHALLRIPVDDPGVLQDIDRPEDLAKHHRTDP
ncbi:MAG: nucleotidyltransferase family protein [Methylococcales bacterium]|nr:nucleotidyltransferase family protein [Methylococcales bacterium]